MSSNLIFGIFFLLVGIVITFGYITKNEKIISKKKREKIGKVYGKKGGSLLYLARYIVGPIVLGIIMILKGLN